MFYSEVQLGMWMCTVYAYVYVQWMYMCGVGVYVRIVYTVLKMGCYFTGLNKTPWGVAAVSMVTLKLADPCTMEWDLLQFLTQCQYLEQQRLFSVFHASSIST